MGSARSLLGSRTLDAMSTAVTFNGPATGAITGPATGVAIGGCRVLAGASSWADRSLVRDGGFYPSRTLSAAQRLAYYTTRLPLAEIATTYRFPPTPEMAKRWAATTPPGFTLDVRAWSLLCGAPTWPESLWPDLQGHVKPSRRDTTKLYRQRLPARIVDECWARFNHALRPLADSGRLGAVIVRFPTWFSPRPAAWKELAELPSRLPGLRVAVELSNERWYEGTACEQTLGVLEEIGLSFVCRHSSVATKPVVAATADIALVRFPGHPPRLASQAGTQSETLADKLTWWGPLHRYSDAELAAWVPAVRDLASSSSEVHMIMDNCWRTNAVDNASTLLGLLASS